MKAITGKETYVSSSSTGGRLFETKESCELYEASFLTDEQLEACFHFFHEKHENQGDLDNAKKPSDATHYKFYIERDGDEQTIKLYKYFRTYPSKKLCNSYTNLGLILKHNQDFVVLYDATRGWGDNHYQGECTYKIKEFYEFLSSLRTTGLSLIEKLKDNN